MNDLISVIIPVYNVEKYLRKCLESVCSQTYTNLEIIVVDDGSTDSSGEICDEYAERDSRIVVIHKSNGGLADARNAGLDIATGQYIGFVDSDDWIECDMYEVLYTFCEKNELDLIAARYIEEREEQENSVAYTGVFKIFSNYEMLRINVCGDKEYLITNSVWDRLYRRRLIEDMRFPVGKCYEDTCYTAEVFLKAERCGYLDSGLYHYRIRNDSIMGKGIKNRDFFNDNLITDLLPLLREKRCLLEDAGLTELVNYSRYLYICTLLDILIKTQGKKQYLEQYRKVKEEFLENKQWFSQYIREKDDIKRGLWMSIISLPAYVWIMRMIKR